MKIYTEDDVAFIRTQEREEILQEIEKWAVGGTSRDCLVHTIKNRGGTKRIEYLFEIVGTLSWGDVIHKKINELIDAVNELRSKT